MPGRTRHGGGSAQGRTSRRSSGRPQLLLVGLAALLAIVAIRLVWLQVVESSELTRAAERQRTRDVKLSPRRGSIFDREGQPLAVTSDAKSIYADPTLVKDATSTAEAVAHILGGTADDYVAKLQKKTHFVYLSRKVSLDRAEALDKLELAGVYMHEDSLRSYPSGTLACQVLGYVGVDDQGLAGIEKQYDSTLAGTPGRIVAERDRLGNTIPGGIITAQEPVDGQDVYLTIDKDIQFKAQAELSKAIKTYDAKSGTVVVMDPRNGEILAMASTPYYDPNNYRDSKPDAQRNKAITDLYEPGSTIKSFTAAAAIDAGLYTPESMFHLPPTIKVGGRTIHESHARGSVDYSLTEIVTHSSNVGAVMIGQKLGKTRLLDYFSRFALSRRTGVDFPGEAGGYTPKQSQFSASTMGNLPFGQGLTVTPVQLVRAMSAIANGGTLVTPHFLMRQSSAVATFPANPERMIGRQAASQATMMLTDVVRQGTGTAAKVRGYEVAGKTGTAQKVANGRYMKGVYISSFVGYLPAGDPQIVILVALDSPRKGLYGGTVAAPAFREIASFCVSHLRIAPAASVGKPAKKSADKGGNKKVSPGGKSTTRTVESTSSGQ